MKKLILCLIASFFAMSAMAEWSLSYKKGEGAWTHNVVPGGDGKVRVNLDANSTYYIYALIDGNGYAWDDVTMRYGNSTNYELKGFVEATLTDLKIHTTIAGEYVFSTSFFDDKQHLTTVYPYGVFLPGSWNEWNVTEDVMFDGGNSLVLQLSAGSYTFKVKNDRAWFGSTGTMPVPHSGWTFYSSNKDNCGIDIAHAGYYRFTYRWESENPVVSVSEVVDPYAGDLGHFATPTNTKVHYDIAYVDNKVVYMLRSTTGYPLDFAQVQVNGAGHDMTIVNGYATYEMSGATLDSEQKILFLYSDTQMGGNEMTAENQSDAAHIITYTVGTGAASLTEDVNYVAAACTASHDNITASSNPGNAWESGDGNLGTRWASANADGDDVWWRADLGARKMINVAQIVWEGAYGRSYDIQYSNDAIHWYNYVSLRGLDLSGFPVTINYKEGLIAARYIRFQGIEKATGYGYSFWELQAKYTTESILTRVLLTADKRVAKVGSPVNLTPVAKDQNDAEMADMEFSYSVSPADAGDFVGNVFTPAKSCEATITVTCGEKQASVPLICAISDNLAQATALGDGKIVGQSTSFNDAYYTVDGNLGSTWQGCPTDGTAADEAARTYDSWFVVDLGDDYDIDAIVTYFEGAWAADYTLQLSSDNSSWTTVFTQTGGADVLPENQRYKYLPSTSFFTAVSSARYVKFHSTKAATQYGMKIYEFFVFGTAGAKDKLATPTGVTVSNGSVSFTAVEHATSYEAHIYDGGDMVTQDNVVPAGTALTYVPASNKTLTVKVVAKGAGYLNSDESDAANWEFNNYLATPTISSLTAATGVITFANVANASSYTAKIYYNGDLVDTQAGVTSGAALTRPAVRNDAYEVKLVAVGTAPYITSNESAGVEWYIAGTPRLPIGTAYCETVEMGKDGNWVSDETSAAKFTWETQNDGSITISISAARTDVTDKTFFRNNGITLAKIKVVVDGNEQSSDTYFNHSINASKSTITLTPTEAGRALPYGTEIVVNNTVEYRTNDTDDNGAEAGTNADLYPTLTFHYLYGTKCLEHGVTVGASASPAEGGETSVKYNGIDVREVEAGTTVTFAATPAEHYHFVKWNDETTTTSYNKVVNANTNLVATFERNESKPVISAASLVMAKYNSVVYSITASCAEYAIDHINVTCASPAINQNVNIVDGKITITGLTPETSYTFALKAVNTEGTESDVYNLSPVSTTLIYPTTTAPVPPLRNEADMRSIYSDRYEWALKHDFAKGKWWSQVTSEEKENAGDHYIFNTTTAAEGYLVLGFNNDGEDDIIAKDIFTDGVDKGLDVRTMTTLHFDVWSLETGANVWVMLCDAAYNTGVRMDGTGWQSFDIDLSNWTDEEKKNIRWMKFAGRDGVAIAPYFAIDNIYFYKPHDAATIPVSATANPIEGGTATAQKGGLKVVLAENNETGIDFVANANSGYRFVNWTNAGGDEVSTDETYSPASITAATHLTANFQKTYNVSATPNDADMGTVSVKQGGDDVTSVDAGTSVTFTATPNPGYTFVRWSNGSTANPYVVASVEEDITLTANFDYGRTVYCHYPLSSIAGGYTMYVSLGKAAEDGQYSIIIEGSEEVKITGINNANTLIRNSKFGAEQGNLRFPKDNGAWQYDPTEYGSASCVFGVQDGKTWRDIDVAELNLWLATNHAEQHVNSVFPAATTIDWSHSCADTEAPELEEPKYDVLSETSVRLSLKATDDRDYIRYTITGFDGGDIMVDASAGVRIYKEVSGMEPNYPYRVTVVAADKAGNTDTKIITVTASPDKTAPFNVKASAMALSMTDILITASADEDRTSDVAYNIYSADGTQLIATFRGAPGETATYKISGLTENTTYTYQVGALNFAGVEATPRITVSATTYGEDLALNQPAYAGYADPNGQVSGSNNGNYSQRWGSGHDNTTDYTDDWWYVDLGSVCSIDNIRILWETARPQMYAIYVSDDAAAWTPVYTTTEAPTSYTNLENHPELFTEYYQFSNRAKGRYVKVAATGNVADKPEGNANLQYGISMWAFEVYGRSSLSGGANITSATQAAISTNSATLNVELESYDPANDYIIVMDPAHGINQRCKIVDVVVKEYANATDKVGTDVPKKQITVVGLNFKTTYNFQLIAVDVEGRESVVYPNTGYVTVKTLNEAPLIGESPMPPFRNGRDFRSLYSDFYKPALKNSDQVSRASWINIDWSEDEVNDNKYILYAYNGNSRESVWGMTGGETSFLARTGGAEDPIFPHLNYTDGVSGHTGLDARGGAPSTSPFTHLHVDLWLQGSTSTTLTIRANDEILVSNAAHSASVESGNGHWYSYDIAITSDMITSLGANLTNLQWMKFQFPGGFNSDYWAIDNVYFYRDVDYSSMHEVRVKANLKEAGTPVIIGVDNEDVYYALNDEHLSFEAHSAEANGYFFINWTDDDDNDDVVSEDDPKVNVVVSNPIHYTANYIRKYKVVGIAKEIDTGVPTGTVTVDLSDASPNVVGGFKFVTPGTSATFTATQNSPYVFKYWALDGKFYSAGADDGSHTVVYENIQRDIELRAIYDKGGAAYESTEIPTGFPEMTSTDGHLRVSYIWLGGKRYRILIEGTPECCITAAYNNFNFYVHNINGGRGGEDGRSFPASVWNEHFFPYGYGYTYVDFEADDANLIKIDADRNYVVFYRTPIAEGASHSGRDLVECKLPAMGIDWRNQYDFHFPLAAKEATPGAGITWGSAAWFNTEVTPGTPTDNTDVFLLSPTTVNVATARAKSVTICKEFTGYLTGHAQAGLPEETPHTGQLTINANAALQVVNKVTNVKGANFYAPLPTTPGDLYLASGAVGGNGALIHGDAEGNTGATVQMYSKAHGTDDGKGNVSNAVWQWMTTPLTSSGDVLDSYYGSWMFQYVNANHGWTHQMVNGSIMESFGAYAITSGSPRTYTLEGTLAATANPAYSYEFANDASPADGDFLTNKGGVQKPTVKGINMFGNSWTAPINIASFHPSDFEGATKSIILFNTGLDVDGTKASSYVTVPIKTAGSMARDCQVIPSMQAFQVDATSNGRLTLDYNRLVRTTAGTGVNVQPMRAPGRAAAVEEENENGIDEKLRIWVKGSRYSDFLYLFRNEETTNGFDDGWDGRKIMSDNWDIPVLTVYSGQRHWQVSTQPQLAGTQLGFLQGEDIEYTIGFEYEGEEDLWLYDSETNTYTAIETGNTYHFISTTFALQTRFIITTREQVDEQPGVVTGVDNQDQRENVTRKVLLNNNMYIINNGCLYDATGKTVR